MVISLMDGPLAMIDHKKQLSKSVDFIVKVLQIYAMTNLWDFNRACAVLVNSFLQIVQRASHLLDFASFSLRNPAIFQ